MISEFKRGHSGWRVDDGLVKGKLEAGAIFLKLEVNYFTIL